MNERATHHHPMSIKDNDDTSFITLGGMWSLLLKLALVSIPVLLTGAIGFAVWLLTTISTIQINAAVLTERVAQLSAHSITPAQPKPAGP